MNDKNSDDRPQSPFSRTIKRLDEYKELITILVFFTGGVIWMYTYFATKNQLDSLRCFTTVNVKYIQSKIEIDSFSKILIDNIKASELLRNNSTDPNAKNKIIELEVTRVDIENNLKRSSDDNREAGSKLLSGDCFEDT